MQFNINLWRKQYDRVNDLGKLLKSYKDQPTAGREDVSHLARLVDDCLKSANGYLDDCGMPRAPVLWQYIPEDPTTHASSPLFMYQERLPVMDEANKLSGA